MTVGQRLWLLATLAKCTECQVERGIATMCPAHASEWTTRAAWTPGTPSISAAKVAEARWGSVSVITGGEAQGG
jgi:hypothetical protein